VAETIAQVLRAQPRAHILVCAPAPFAADVLASKLVSKHGLSHTQLVRINDPRRDFASVKGDVLPFCSREVRLRTHLTSPHTSPLLNIVHAPRACPRLTPQPSSSMPTNNTVRL